MTRGVVGEAAPPDGRPPPRRREIFLRPGDYAVADATHRLRTVLGSCVSVTLWCSCMRVGAMSHFLLATRGGAARSFDDRVGLDLQALDGRYGDEALRLMLTGLARLGVDPMQCAAKIFGGGNMFPNHTQGGTPAVGRRNGEAARELLQARGIEVMSESLFGDGCRQIVFDVRNGDVWVRQLAPGAVGHPPLPRERA